MEKNPVRKWTKDMNIQCNEEKIQKTEKMPILASPEMQT